MKATSLSADEAAQLDLFHSLAGVSEAVATATISTIEGICGEFEGDPNFIGVSPILRWEVESLPESPDVQFCLCYAGIDQTSVYAEACRRVRAIFPDIGFPMDHIGKTYFPANLAPHAGTTHWASMVAEICRPWIGDTVRIGKFRKLAMDRMKLLRDKQSIGRQLKAFIDTMLCMELAVRPVVASDGSGIVPNLKSETLPSSAMKRFLYWRSTFFELLAQSRS